MLRYAYLLGVKKPVSKKSVFIKNDNKKIISKKELLSLFNAEVSKIELFDNKKILEVSTSSKVKIGKLLDSSKLKYGDYYFESYFESCKVLDNGFGFKNVKELKPAEARKFVNNNKGIKKHVIYKFNGYEFPIYPVSFFYDYLYCLAVNENKDINKEELKEYEVFTNINRNVDDFNSAPALCKYVYLLRNNLLNVLDNPNDFLRLFYNLNTVNKYGHYTSSNDFVYSEDKTIVDCLTDDNVLIINEKHDNKEIERIGKYCFANNYNLEKIIIPPTVKVIDKGAFKNCYNLREVIIQGSDVVIKEDCFDHCLNLEKINFSSNYYFGQMANDILLEYHAFNECNKLEKVNIRSNKLRIEDDVFNNCENIIDIDFHVNELYLNGSISNLRRLKTLNINNIVHYELPIVSNCISLQSIDMSIHIHNEKNINLETNMFNDTPSLRVINTYNIDDNEYINKVFNKMGVEIKKVFD